MDRTDQELVSVLWWTLLIKGIAAILFGLAAVFWPVPTAIIIVYAFGVFIVVSGIMNLVYSLTGRGRHWMWLWTLIIGILEIGVGIYAIRHPGISLGALILLLGFTFLIRGILEIIAAFLARTPDGASRALLVIGGILGVIVGFYIVVEPVSGGLAFVWALGIWALVVGSMDIARSIASHHMLEAARA